MDCAAVKPRMEALVRGTLPPSEREDAEQHIASCEGCRLELELVRAVGSQEGEPGATPEKADWSLDRIFGAESGGAPSAAASAEPPASGLAIESLAPSNDPEPHPAPLPPASEDSPSSESPVVDPAPVPAPAEADAKSEEGSWDFEPADAPSEVKPTEGSLFFAEEALTRRRESARKKGSPARVLYWTVGGIVGAAGLALASWFAFHIGDKPDVGFDRYLPHATAARDSSAAAQTNPPATDTPPPPTVDPTPAPAPEPPGEGVEQGTSAPAPETPAPSPQVTAATVLPPSGSLPDAGARSLSDSHPPSTSKRSVGTKDSETPRKTTAKAPAGPGTRRAPVVEPSTPTDESDGVGADEEDGGAWTEPEWSTEPTPTKTGHTGGPGSRTTTPGRSTATPSTVTPAAPEEPPATESAPAEPATPFDRLHLATVTAAQDEDLAGLRRLRTTWKEFIGKSVGPQRAIARRELADCLWSIQSITGRRSDQKEALSAYHDYLLIAPAGGADSRSVARLRQLEDALSEH